MTGHRSSTLAPTRWPAVVALVGVLAALGFALVNRLDTSTASAASGDQPDAASTAPSVVRDAAGRANLATPADSQVDPERPTSLRLPSGATMAVESTATASDGDLMIPTDINHAGWWDGSSRIGDPFGSIVVAAHVDSFSQGLGRFAELLDMLPGDVVGVRAKSIDQSFRVVSARLVPKASLSEQPAVFAATGRPRLVLITCGGDYDPAQGGYQDNMIVIAVPQRHSGR